MFEIAQVLDRFHSSNVFHFIIVVFFVATGFLCQSDFVSINRDLFKAGAIIVVVNYLILPLLVLLCSMMLPVTDIQIFGLLVAIFFAGGRFSILYCVLFKGYVTHSVVYVLFIRVVSAVFGVAVLSMYTTLLPQSHFLVGQLNSINYLTLFEDSLKLILLPFVLGLLMKAFIGDKFDVMVRPIIAIMYLLLIGMRIVSFLMSYEFLFEEGTFILLITIMVNAIALIVPFCLAKACGFERENAISISMVASTGNFVLIYALITPLLPLYGSLYLILLVWGWSSFLISVSIFSLWEVKKLLNRRLSL